MIVLLLLAVLGCVQGESLISATFASEPERAFFLLKAFRHHAHNNVHVLGNGTRFEGSIHKLKLLKELVDSPVVLDSDLLLVCDGYFTLVTAQPRQFIRNFRSFGADIVFAAKAGLGEPDVPSATSRFKYLSSAALMGRVSAIKRLLEQDFSTFSTDADFYRSAFKTGSLRMKLDTQKSLFCALSDHEGRPDDIHYENNRFSVQETSSVPLLLFASHSASMHEFYSILRRKIQPNIHFRDMDIYPSVLRKGETLFFQVTVSNFNKDFALPNQLPYPAHVYNDSSTFVDDNFGSTYAGFRLGIDYSDRVGIDHPWRWGMGEDILSGNGKTVVLGVQMNSCFTDREFDIGYVFENFFWVVSMFKKRVTVLCD